MSAKKIGSDIAHMSWFQPPTPSPLPAWPPQCLKIPLPSKATTHPSCQLSSPLPGTPRSSLGLYHTPPHPDTASGPLPDSLVLLVRWAKGTPPWVWLALDDWERGSQAGQLPLTCQCLVTAFHTPIRPVWLVAMSWFPAKNKASTGTPQVEDSCRG